MQIVGQDSVQINMKDTARDGTSLLPHITVAVRLDQTNASTLDYLYGMAERTRLRRVA